MHFPFIDHGLGVANSVAVAEKEEGYGSEGSEVAGVEEVVMIYVD